MKKIFIVGLGLMGGSYAMGLRNKYEVYGFDLDEEVVSKALKRGLIKDSNLDHISTSDIVLLSLYPHNNIDFIKENLKLFNKNQLITDLSGVKVNMVNEIVDLLPSDFRYTSHHPMCGRETLGIDYANTEMFSGSNFIITPTKLTNNNDLNILIRLANDLNFGNIITVSPNEHDELIAYTSQLTHLIAVSLMLANDNDNIIRTTGDSFRDLTRIANINEKLWTELFLSNKKALTNQIGNFIDKLSELKQLIEFDETEKLKESLIKSREKRVKFDQIKNK